MVRGLVRFVDIGGIVNHHYLNCLFIDNNILEGGL
jgi:hypothetical protein